MRQHIVFGLADALPASQSNVTPSRIDAVYDAGHGACLLRHPACAEAVEQAILHSDGERYRLLAWCVMPNHVHVVLEQGPGYTLGKVIQAWKSSTAHAINRKMQREGRLWRREYFDRFMRDEQQLQATIEYVECNPVSAGLVSAAVDWPWSSIRRR